MRQVTHLRLCSTVLTNSLISRSNAIYCTLPTSTSPGLHLHISPRLSRLKVRLPQSGKPTLTMLTLGSSVLVPDLYEPAQFVALSSGFDTLPLHCSLPSMLHICASFSRLIDPLCQYPCYLRVLKAMLTLYSVPVAPKPFSICFLVEPMPRNREDV